MSENEEKDVAEGADAAEAASEDNAAPEASAEKGNDGVLTDEEKGALLDGMESGEVEVHSSKGPGYAAVTEFEVGPRSRITTDSYPRLQNLNKQFAGRIDKLMEQLLNTESDVEFQFLRTETFSEFCERIDGLAMLIEFAPKPLEGSALISIDAAGIELLVETFYGGDSDESARKDADFFTRGEISVANLFAKVILNVTGDVWQPLDNFEFELVTTHLNSGVIDCVDGGDNVIAAEFVLRVGETFHPFHILWPTSTVAPLLPVFDGQKRERDAVKDAHWQRALRAGVVDADVQLASGVGHIEMSLRDVATLEAGDVITITNPQRGTVYAGDVAVLDGRFGVHDGRYAIEARRWIEKDATTL